MALFGAKMLVDGIPQPIDTGIAPAPMAAPAQEQFKAPKRSFADNLGLLADAFTGSNQNGMMLQQRNDHLREEFMARNRLAQQQAAQWDMWTRQKLWERANPAPVSNDTVNDYNFIAGKLGQGEADKYLRSVAAGPPVAIEGIDANGNQTRTLVPRSQAYGGSGPATPPEGAVQMLRGNPSLAAQFDQKYGAGAASRILGGAGPQGSATFP